jgi:hypothetical protein
MLTIYHRPNKSRKREAAFFHALKRQFPEANPSKDLVLPDLPDKCVDRDQLIVWLKADTLLSDAKRQDCIKRLQARRCPPQLKVALEPSKISFDFVIVQGDKTWYWEFHEEQHRTLKDARPKQVFARDGKPFDVPRYLQRLIRDVWRVLYVRPYTIVWFDWFAANQAIYLPSLQDGLYEFHLSDRFSFREFCQMPEGT